MKTEAVIRAHNEEEEDRRRARRRWRRCSSTRDRACTYAAGKKCPLSTELEEAEPGLVTEHGKRRRREGHRLAEAASS